MSHLISKRKIKLFREVLGAATAGQQMPDFEENANFSSALFFYQ